MQAREMIKIIKRDNLVENTAQVGDYIYEGLRSIANGPGAGKIDRLRGKDEGTFIAFDAKTSEKRDAFIKNIRNLGVNMGSCGDQSVRLRPMLVFQRHHADVFLDKAEQVIKEL